jgi:hypothetical protein
VPGDFPDRVVEATRTGFEHADVAARRIEGDKADLIDGRDIGRRAAIQDRSLRPVDLHRGIVDADARRADSTCSAVEISGPEASPKTVANSVAVTAQMSARISRSRPPGRPVRMNVIPVSASAGCNVSVTGNPECTPTPDNAT